MTRMKLALGTLGVTLAAAVPSAAADDTFFLGRSVSVGGGVSTFAQDDQRDFLGTAGTWDARLGLFTKLPIAFELAYLGSAQTIDALGLEDDAVLLSNGAEATARLNVLPGLLVSPYIVGGVAWRRYSVVNSDRNTSDLVAEDDVLELPIGLGADLRLGHFLVDARATYRPAFDDELAGDDVDLDDAVSRDTDLHTVGARIAVGMEF